MSPSGSKKKIFRHTMFRRTPVVGKYHSGQAADEFEQVAVEFGQAMVEFGLVTVEFGQVTVGFGQVTLNFW